MSTERIVQILTEMRDELETPWAIVDPFATSTEAHNIKVIKCKLTELIKAIKEAN